MKLKQYVEGVCHINTLLSDFPDPSSLIVTNSIPEDKLLNLLEFSLPSKWQRHMVIHGFGPVENNIPKFVAFCERTLMPTRRYHPRASSFGGDRF